MMLWRKEWPEDTFAVVQQLTNSFSLVVSTWRLRPKP
jgi:hypothetical protein